MPREVETSLQTLTMPEEFDYIERYFEGKFSQSEVQDLEKRIEEDPELAEQMAFYISTLRAVQNNPAQQTKERFRKIFDESEPSNLTAQPVVRRMWPYAVAAAVAAVVVMLVVFYPSHSSSRLADQYISSHLQTLPVTMDNRESNFKTAVRLYNEGKLPEALVQFEMIVSKDSADFRAKENAGIVSLRLKNYDKAIGYFGELENYPGLYANPGKFYHALTLLKRNLPGDTQQARLLLQDVVRDHLDLDREAQQLLDRL